MRVLKFILCCLILPLLGLSQNDEVEISGKIYAFALRYDLDTLPLKNAEVFLKINDSIIVKQITDVNGRYNFTIKAVNRKAVLYGRSTKKTFSKEKRQYCFYDVKDKIVIDLSQSKKYIANFKFNQTTDCMYWLPEFFFEENSHQVDFVDSLKVIVGLLEDFPKVTLQINGHSDTTEINPTELSYKRAEAVAIKLVEAGIDQTRLSLKALGATWSRASPKIIRKAKESDRSALQRLNRNVSFQITKFEIE